MGEFRIGRKSAQHSYPTPRFAGTAQAARNFALGPAQDQTIDPDLGETLEWDTIDSGAPSGVNVPITPQSSGIIRVDAVIPVKSTSAFPIRVQIQVLLNGTPLAPPGDPLAPLFDTDTILDSEHTVIPILAQTPAQAVGVPVNIGILATILTTSGTAFFVGESSTIEVQEVPASTG